MTKWSAAKRFFIGNPLPTEHLAYERLSKIQALAVLSSDALSSTAYATEEILLVLVVAGSSAINLSIPIAIAIAALLAIVAASYYQTVHAYPQGGGAYRVVKDNLSDNLSLLAGSSLLVDYILTVAVSISAGVAAITSAFPLFTPYRVALGVILITFMTVVNLRGVRDTGKVFALPTYLFLISMFVMVIVGLVRYFFLPQTISWIAVSVGTTESVQGLTTFLILRAFASGCTALTGIEAISDGVPVFKPPEADNAGKTLLAMATILITLFLSITILVHLYRLTPVEGETLVSHLAHEVFRGAPWMYYTVQVMTALILLLAANTSFSDFPRLSSFMAIDGFMPRQMAQLGDRLVFANGIITLGVLASLFIIIFGGSTHALIPLYAVGVFISFTLSQTGMVKRWLRLRSPNWRHHATFNAVGAFTTGIVLLVVITTKFIHGAWLVLVLIGIMIYAFKSVHRHYETLAAQLRLTHWKHPERLEMKHHKVVLPISGVHRGTIKAVKYARIIADDIVAVTVDLDPERTKKLQYQWAQWHNDIPLVILPSPYRSVVEPIVRYINNLFSEEEGVWITVLMPEFIPARWWHHLLHNQTAFLLRSALLYRKHPANRLRVVTDIPYWLRR